MQVKTLQIVYQFKFQGLILLETHLPIMSDVMGLAAMDDDDIMALLISLGLDVI